jgi:hypothetical protein
LVHRGGLRFGHDLLLPSKFLKRDGKAGAYLPVQQSYCFEPGARPRTCIARERCGGETNPPVYQRAERIDDHTEFGVSGVRSAMPRDCLRKNFDGVVRAAGDVPEGPGSMIRRLTQRKHLPGKAAVVPMVHRICLLGSNLRRKDSGRSEQDHDGEL